MRLIGYFQTITAVLKKKIVMSYGYSTNVDKRIVDTFVYEWVNGKARRTGTASELEIPTVDETPGPLWDWIKHPDMLLGSYIVLA